MNESAIPPTHVTPMSFGRWFVHAYGCNERGCISGGLTCKGEIAYDEGAIPNIIAAQRFFHLENYLDKKEQKVIYPEVVKDLLERVAMGKEKYGVPLTTNNGRKALQDAYEEALDLAMYLKQRIMEDAE